MIASIIALSLSLSQQTSDVLTGIEGPLPLEPEELAFFPAGQPPVQEPTLLTMKLKANSTAPRGDMHWIPDPEYTFSEPRLDAPMDRFHAFWMLNDGGRQITRQWIVFDWPERGRPTRAIRFRYRLTEAATGGYESTLSEIAYFAHEPGGAATAPLAHVWTVDMEPVLASRLSEEPVRRPVRLTRYKMGQVVETVIVTYEDQAPHRSRRITSTSIERVRSFFNISEDTDPDGNPFLLGQDYGSSSANPVIPDPTDPLAITLRTIQPPAFPVTPQRDAEHEHMLRTRSERWP